MADPEIMKCVCELTEYSGYFVERIKDLQLLLPDFAEHSEVYPHDAKLSLRLEAIFRDCIDYYIIIITYLRQRRVGSLRHV